MNENNFTLSNTDDKRAAKETLALCQNAIDTHSKIWTGLSDAEAELEQNAEKISNDVQELFNGIYSKIWKLKDVSQTKIQATLHEKRIQFTQRKYAVNQMINNLRQLEKNLENVQISFSERSSKPTAEELCDLAFIRKQIEGFVEENKKLPEFTESCCSIMDPQEIENLNTLLNCANNALSYSCSGIDQEKTSEKHIADEIEASSVTAKEMSEKLSSLPASSTSSFGLKNNPNVSSCSGYSGPSNETYENSTGENYTYITASGKMLEIKKATAQMIPYFRDLTNAENIERHSNENGEIILEDEINWRYLQPIIASLEQNNVSFLLSRLPSECSVIDMMKMCSYLGVPLNVTDDLFGIQDSLSNTSEIPKVVTSFCLAITLGKYDQMSCLIWCKIYEIFLNIFEDKSKFLSPQLLCHLRRCVYRCVDKFFDPQRERLHVAMYF